MPSDDPLKKHKDLAGKISVEPKVRISNQSELSMYYTPGVADVSNHIKDNPGEARDFTWLNNSVAVVSDGSAVLGLGDIGPQASLPVMEGKCMLFKQFAGIDAVPIVLDVHSTDEIVDVVKAIAPGFGGINLEDIAAPICFEVEERLKSELPVPVMHDDQHGTAIVVLAGIINSLKITGKKLGGCRITVNGTGSAGIAVIKLLKVYAPKVKILALDSQGVIYKGRDDLTPVKQSLVDKKLVFAEEDGDLAKALIDSDIFIGVSKGNVVTPEMIEKMNKKPIVFAMANPSPEIMPDEAKKAGAAVVATGRSDFPNQINNALVFPGVFRGALDNRVNKITDEHKIAAAEAIAGLIGNPSPNEIIPSIFDKRLVPAIAKVIS
jgi:malate dehydrogenase (oxaloacetate-decarboxylating)